MYGSKKRKTTSSQAPKRPVKASKTVVSVVSNVEDPFFDEFFDVREKTTVKATAISTVPTSSTILYFLISIFTKQELFVAPASFIKPIECTINEVKEGSIVNLTREKKKGEEKSEVLFIGKTEDECLEKKAEEQRRRVLAVAEARAPTLESRTSKTDLAFQVERLEVQLEARDEDLKVEQNRYEELHEKYFGVLNSVNDLKEEIRVLKEANSSLRNEKDDYKTKLSQYENQSNHQNDAQVPSQTLMMEKMDKILAKMDQNVSAIIVICYLL